MREGGTGWAPMCISRHWDNCSSRPPKVLVDDEDEAAIYYSSGTTGFPKAILLKHTALMAQGTSSQTMVHFSWLAAWKMDAGELPLRSTALLPVRLRLENQNCGRAECPRPAGGGGRAVRQGPRRDGVSTAPAAWAFRFFRWGCGGRRRK